MIRDAFTAPLVNKSLEAILENIENRLPEGFTASTAIVDAKGELLQVRGQNPLHFTSFEAITRSIKTYFSPKSNEVFVTNDPYSGSPRLCDLTLVQGCFGNQVANELRYFIAVQVSLPQLINKEWKSLFSSVEDEGFRIPPSPLDQGSLINPAIVDYMAQSGIDKTFLTELMGALKIALKKAVGELAFLESSLTRDKFQNALDDLKKYSELQMRQALREIPDGEYEAQEFLDGDGKSENQIKIQCTLSVQGDGVLLNFAGTSKQTDSCYNSSYPLTLAACFTVLRNLLGKDIPINSGTFLTFSIAAQEGTIVNATYPKALLGGYFETTRRIADVIKTCLSKALPKVTPSLSGGSSSPALIKFNTDEKTTLIFETLGSGAGASPQANGAQGIKTEFDNSPALSIEEFETKYSAQIIQSGLRDSNPGDGKFKGGKGITRGYKFLGKAQVMLLGDRLRTKIHGLAGGTSGTGAEISVMKAGDKKNPHKDCAKGLINLDVGDILFLSSPSGAGWGKHEKQDDELSEE